MLSFRNRDGWTSVFDKLEESQDQIDSNSILLKLPVQGQVTCYVNYQFVPSEHTEQVNLTDKGFYYSYFYNNEQKYFCFQYDTCWQEDISNEDFNSNNSTYQGTLRLSKKDHVVEQVFLEQDIFLAVKKMLKNHAIAQDYKERFKILDRIGHGASADVFKILDKNKNKHFAGKMISKEYLDKTHKRVISVANEIDVLRKLDHPNIVKLQEVFEIEDYVILVMELLEGEALNPDLFNHDDQELAIKHVFSQIISAIKFMNDTGLMHRDIKPNNLRFVKKYNYKKVCEANQIKQIDFGFCEYYNKEKFTRYYCGTVGYMCPFLMNMSKSSPQTYGPAVDIFSIGVLIYYASTGEKVFTAKNHEEKRRLNKMNAVPYQKIASAEINGDQKDLIFETLKTDPKERLTMNALLSSSYFRDFIQPYLFKPKS